MRHTRVKILSKTNAFPQIHSGWANLVDYGNTIINVRKKTECLEADSSTQNWKILKQISNDSGKTQEF